MKKIAFTSGIPLFRTFRRQGRYNQQPGSNLKKPIYTLLIWAICLGFCTSSFGQQYQETQSIGGETFGIKLTFQGINNNGPPPWFGKPLKMSAGLNGGVTSSQFAEMK